MRRPALFYWLIGILIAAVIATLAFYFDDAVREFVAQHQDRTVRQWMLWVSRAGDWPGHLLVGSVLLGGAFLRGNKKWTRIFLSMIIALAIGGLAGRAMKVAFPRARPSVKSEATWGGPRFNSKYHAFPSGHVAASTAFFAVLVLARRRIGIACLPIPIVIGFSRIYLQAHYLSDVVCAGLLGILCALLVARLLLSTPNIEHVRIA